MLDAMNAPLYGNRSFGYASGPMQLAVIRIDVAVRAAHQFFVYAALALANTYGFPCSGEGALVSFHAVMDQARICKEKITLLSKHLLFIVF